MREVEKGERRREGVWLYMCVCMPTCIWLPLHSCTHTHLSDRGVLERPCTGSSGGDGGLDILPACATAHASRLCC